MLSFGETNHPFKQTLIDYSNKKMIRTNFTN